MIGEKISHYKILEKLGEGGMGVVYKAEDNKLKRFVALKFLPFEWTRDAEVKARFIQEAQAASSLQHNNICTIHEIDETGDGQMFICMDYYKGETLKKKIEQGSLALEEALDIAEQIARGLSIAHETEIVHRDIKPANILITDRGEVKIVDFGLAKLAGQTNLTKTGTTLGTTAYMSPEQAQGHETDHRSDLFSTGVILYEMIAGKHPFKGDYDQAVIYSIINEVPEPVTNVDTDLPVGLEEIINKALEKDTQARYQNSNDLAADLRNLRKATNSGDRAEPDKIVVKKSGNLKSFRKILMALPWVIGLAVVFLLLRPIFEEEILVSSPRPVVVMPFENLTGDASFDYLRTAIPNLLITNIEQSKYLSVLTWERMQDLLRIMGKKELELVDIDKKLGFELCKADGIFKIVLGSFTRAGDIFATDIKVLDVASKRLLKSANTRGEGVGSILDSQIDELSKIISRSVTMQSSPVERETFKVTEVTTNSLEAYKFYHEGLSAYYKFDFVRGTYNFQEAVNLDSTFAMSLYFLSLSNRALGKFQSATTNLNAALTYSKKASEKEALYIRMHYASVEETDFPKALSLNEKLVQRFPKEKEAHRKLGDKYRLAEKYAEAIHAYKNAIALDPEWGNVYNSLGYIYAFIGEYEKAIACIEKYITLSPAGPNPYDSAGEMYLMAGKLDDAIAKLEFASEKFPNWYGTNWVTLSYVYALKENYDLSLRQYDKMSAIYQQYLSAEENIGLLVFTFRSLGVLYYILGRDTEARDLYKKQESYADRSGNDIDKARAYELTAFIDSDKGAFEEAEFGLQACFKIRSNLSADFRLGGEVSLNYISGFFDLKAGKVESAGEKLARAKRILPEVDHRSQEIHAYWTALLAGEVALAEGNSNKAIELFQQVTPLNPYYTNWWGKYLYYLPLDRDGLARAYHLAGDLDKAIDEYKRLIRFDPESKERFFILPKYHYRLATLYEEKGWQGLAIQEYERFLEIWKDADADLSELIDSKARLAKLKERSQN
jgi:serine/threonine protein kinase/predicted Zn-dependent protease